MAAGGAGAFAAKKKEIKILPPSLKTFPKKLSLLMTKQNQHWKC